MLGPEMPAGGREKGAKEEKKKTFHSQRFFCVALRKVCVVYLVTTALLSTGTSDKVQI